MAQAKTRSSRVPRRPKPDPIFAAIAAYKEALALWHKASAAEKSLRYRLPADIINGQPLVLGSHQFLHPIDITRHVEERIAIKSQHFGPTAARRFRRISETAKAELLRIYVAHQAALRKRQTAAGWTAAADRLNKAYVAVYASKWKLVKTVPTSHDGLLAVIAQLREPGPHMASTNEYFLSTLEKAVARINRALLLRIAYQHGRIDGKALGARGDAR